MCHYHEKKTKQFSYYFLWANIQKTTSKILQSFDVAIRSYCFPLFQRVEKNRHLIFNTLRNSMTARWFNASQWQPFSHALQCCYLLTEHDDTATECRGMSEELSHLPQFHTSTIFKDIQPKCYYFLTVLCINVINNVTP